MNESKVSSSGIKIEKSLRSLLKRKVLKVKSVPRGGAKRRRQRDRAPAQLSSACLSINRPEPSPPSHVPNLQCAIVEISYTDKKTQLHKSFLFTA